MSYSRLCNALNIFTQCQQFPDDFESNADHRHHISFTRAQLKRSLAQFNGNWPVDIGNNFNHMNKLLDFYLKRYVREGITKIMTVSADDAISLGLPTNIRIFIDTQNRINEGKRKILGNTLSIAPFTHPHYATALFSNCIVYFADSKEALIDLHHNTLHTFAKSRAMASDMYEWAKTLPFPPAFLVVTDPNSLLLDCNELSSMDVPILHSLYIPREMLTLLASESDGLDQAVWESLVINSIAPCYEILARFAGLTNKISLPLTDSIEIVQERYRSLDGSFVSGALMHQGHINNEPKTIRAIPVNPKKRYSSYGSFELLEKPTHREIETNYLESEEKHSILKKSYS